jgi:hypothetical protein
MIITLRSPFETARGKDSPGASGEVLYPVGKRQFSRSWVQPANPKTEMQTAIRALFAVASTAFSTITDANRATWKVLNDALPKKDKNGAEYKKTDKGWYTSVNVLRQMAGSAIIANAPEAVSEVGALSIETATIDGDSVIILATGVAAGKRYLVRVTNGMHNEQQNPRGYVLPFPVLSQNFVTAGVGGAIVITIGTTGTNIAGLAVGNFIGVALTGISDGYVEGGSLAKKLTIGSA